jgi:hypothetical protein
MADMVFHEVEKGPGFATYQGPLGVVRTDWNGGTVRFIYVGHIEAAVAPVCIQRWDAALRAAPSVVMFMDYWDATGYDSAWRVDCTEWGKKNPGRVSQAHVVSRSKLLNMAVSVAGLALPGLVIKSYGKRAEFDVLAKKAGLPLNPPMPQLVTAKQF